jgi:indole-3-glycerol phosphate synthase
MVDPYQIYEAKMLGADCILLIVAMLDDAKLQELEQVAIELNLSVLIEVHNQEELLRASKLKSKLLGINSRNLKTLEVNLQNILELAKQVDKSYTLVAESGINSPADLKKLKQAGINCFLIGEYFMRQNQLAQAVKSMLEA